MQISWTMTYDGLWHLGIYPSLKCTHVEENLYLYVIYDFHLKNLDDIHLGFQKSKLNSNVLIWIFECGYVIFILLSLVHTFWDPKHVHNKCTRLHLHLSPLHIGKAMT